MRSSAMRVASRRMLAPQHRTMLTAAAYNLAKKQMPKMSETEKIALGAAKCQIVDGAFCHPACCATSLAAIARLEDIAGWATLTADAKLQVRAAAASTRSCLDFPRAARTPAGASPAPGPVSPTAGAGARRRLPPAAPPNHRWRQRRST